MKLATGQVYKNSSGGEMQIREYAPPHINCLGELWFAVSPDKHFGDAPYLVTVQGLQDAGYAEVKE